MELKQNRIKRKRGVVLTPKGLKKLQEAIISSEIVENQGDRFTLEKLSQRTNISPRTISRLWSLSKGVDQKTLKLCFNAFDLELQDEYYSFVQDEEENQTEISEFVSENSYTKEQSYWPYPDRPVPLDSPLYIERPPIEEQVYREITQPGCVIRIRSPRQMGKTSLVMRLLAFAQKQEYHALNINCDQLDEQCLTDLNRLLRCFCLQIATQLGIDSNIDDQWDDEIGCKLSCSLYIQNYLLKQSENPIVLVLSEVDRFFEYPQLGREFFALLRSWCDEARQNNHWQKLRLVVVYSTEQYISLDINHSPFNIGLPIRLREFTVQQVEELARRYGIELTNQELKQLISLVGGHPGLLQLALFNLLCGSMTLQELIAEAIANGGIYRYHLWQHWVNLQANPGLIKIYAELVTAQKGINLDPVYAYKLESLGLISFEGDRIVPRCELYRNYFAKQLATST
ncbi:MULTISPECIES: AAA-like domain-containing protein [Calothrix]|uniref:AAA-like domain-containing protein n=2 Tax=Calothrix TaxID=1186 RepID=A0ABR8A4H8_9CYAN|nr:MULTISPECIES: AAA-like domain-containing protein [Calothrix]MBD2194862.1 AAA-like domain-containing protein [Calothrix parietina FACHB-288]MBD2223460.1 AAA-like domain-containing protein [Calothrix anomala FACHB-343]